jgi:ATP-binding cassette subfamily F protein 3
LLILDEPTTHLDLAARELLQEALSSFKGTVLLVSHDIEFVRGTASVILAVEENGPKKYFGNYDYYLSKIAENQSANITKDITGNKKVTPEAPENNMLAKDRRRQRAQARQAISGKLREYKDKVAKLEEDLENFSNQKDVIMAKLSSGMNVDFAALKKELASLDNKIESTEIEWEEAATELEALRLENARIND